MQRGSFFYKESFLLHTSHNFGHSPPHHWSFWASRTLLGGGQRPSQLRDGPFHHAKHAKHSHEVHLATLTVLSQQWIFFPTRHRSRSFIVRLPDSLLNNILSGLIALLLGQSPCVTALITCSSMSPFSEL